MTVTATAHQGEPLDALCWRVLGTTAGDVVEQALELNPGLAATALLAEGAVVILPDPPASDATATLDTTNLWD